MSQRAFWNAVADTKTFSHPLDLARFAPLVTPDARILDYGCGYGRLCRELRAAGFVNLTGVDPAKRMLERARAENPGVAFRVIAEAGLPFHDASFDAVVLFSVLTCIVSDGGQRAVIGEIARVLRPGGIVYISDILIQDDERNRARYDRDEGRFGPYGVFEMEPGVVFRHLARARVDELIRGFRPIELREIDVKTMHGNPARAFQFFGARAGDGE
jgi:SAM-dependent methyltransferase